MLNAVKHLGKPPELLSNYFTAFSMAEAGRELRNFVAVKFFVGKFSVEEAFRITGLGWVLVGELEGNILSGYRLDFGNDVILQVSGIQLTRVYNSDKISLVIFNQFESRQKLVDQNIIGATAQILE